MLCVRRDILFMKIKISEMLDNSVEILTKEKADIDNLKDIQDMVYKKIIRQKKHSYFLKPVAAVGTICLVTGSIVLAKTLLAPGGKVEKAENLEKEHTLYESDTEEGKIVVDIQTELLATVYKGNIIKNLIMDCQSYTKYRPNETTGGIFVSWRRKEELPTGA